jgi:cyclase
MLRELVSKNIFVFTSELYAQVTAGAILTPEGAIVIDTLAFPAETQQILRFVEGRHHVPIRYVINTHYHADHTYGTCLFDDAQVISYALCRELLDGPGRSSLEAARMTSRELDQIRIRLPDVVFDEGELKLHLGGVELTMRHSPGHSPDSITCLVENEGILFAADTMMPVPFFADGSWHDFVSSLQAMLELECEMIVQGHGEVILRGELQSRIEQDLEYLHVIRDRVSAVVEAGEGPQALDAIDIESCGKSRISLNGIVQQLHRGNLEWLYTELSAAQA